MSRETLKDARFHIIGYIETDTNGRQTAKNARFTIVGHYDPRSNTTVDARFHRVSIGNTLAALIYCN
jgi:hypothetical protein